MLVVFVLVTWKTRIAFTFLINMMKNRLVTGTGSSNYATRHGTVYKHSITDHFTLSGLKHRRTIIFCNSVNVSFNSSGSGKLWGSLLSYIFCHSPIFSETWLLEKKPTSTINAWSLFFYVYQRQTTLYCHLSHLISTSENNPTVELSTLNGEKSLSTMLLRRDSTWKVPSWQ